MQTRCSTSRGKVRGARGSAARQMWQEGGWLLPTLLTLFLFCPGAGAASLSLSEAVKLAASGNLRVAASRHALSATRWEKRKAAAQLLPSISVNSTYTRLDPQTVKRANAFGREMVLWVPDSSGNFRQVRIEIPQTVFENGYQSSLSASWNVFNPMLWSARSIAAAAEGTAAIGLLSERESAMHSAATAFLDLLKAQALSDLQGRQLERARKNLEQARRLFKVGRYAEAEVLRWQVEVLKQRSLLEQQATARTIASLNLEKAIGRPATGTTEADTTLPPRLLEFAEKCLEAGGIPEGVRGRQAEPPAVRAAAASVELARRQVRQSILGAFPLLSISASYGWQNNDTVWLDGERTWSITAAFTWPVLDGGTTWTSAKAAKERLAEAEARLQQARVEAQAAEEAARRAVASQVQQVLLAREALKSARRNYTTALHRLEVGQLGNIEWLDATLTFSAAEITATTSWYDLLAAIADFYFATGRMADVPGLEGADD